MGKLRYLTVNDYAILWDRHPQTIYRRISEDKLIAISEPGGGKGKLIPVCDCPDNPFPRKSLCLDCKKDLN